MAFKLADRVKQTATTTGTGAFTLSATPTGFRAFSAVLSTSDTTYYTIAHQTLDEWEVGYGTYSSANTLTRTKVIASTNANAAVNFSAGTKDVFITLPAVGAFGNNIVLGSNITYDQSVRTSSVIFGTGISNAGTGNSVVIGANASNVNGGNVVIGLSANAASANGNAVVIGAMASASGVADNATAVGVGAGGYGYNAVALGNNATAGPYAVAVGAQASAGSFNTGAIAIGNNTQAQFEYSVVIGTATTGSSTGYEIRIGASQTADTGSQNILIGNGISSAPYARSNSIAIGNNITVTESNATYMNQFRTSVTPVGTEWVLKWDDGTNEVYAAPASPVVANWYTYQDNGVTFTSLNLATPSGIATTSNPGSDTWLFAQAPLSPPGWSSSSGFGSFTPYSASSYPVTTPITGSMFSGMATCYYAGYATDAGTGSTYQVYTGGSTYLTSGAFISVGSFPLFGASPVGHAIVMASGNYIGGFTPSGTATLVEEKYDSVANYTYFFVDIDTTTLSAISSGGTVGALSSSSSTVFVAIWYNY